MNNLEYFKDQLDTYRIHTLAHCVAETGKCFFDSYNIKQDFTFGCKRQGVSNDMERYFICRKCIKEWFER